MQYPTITICPGRGMTGEPYGFLEEFFNMVDPKDEQVREMFDAIPRKIFRDRYEANTVYFEGDTQDNPNTGASEPWHATLGLFLFLGIGVFTVQTPTVHHVTFM